ncbi:flagellar biosynthetic protein FliR [Flocculibacter collagenilyticus]|uniref:flagellar biosynthetic protein FliR n=1 Tax=Flocculibacter collagenilyticus TaxID=2744479 RepID=UPI0018F4B765|nr:flagellar biosynthetic protein FliR [Flocculibacter collagenilyticus]
MFEYPLDVIMQWLADFLLPAIRISAMVMLMIGIGAKTIPMRIKSAFALMTAFVVAPVLPPSTFTNLFSFEMILVVMQEILIGSIIGFISTLMINTFVLAGQMLAMQTGLGFASIIDPLNGTSVPAVGQFYLILATLLFWIFDGHLTMIHMIVHSFKVFPIGQYVWDIQSFKDIANWGAWLFATALVLALAPITAIMVVNLAFGIMTRAAPQLNIFTIGFPVTMTSGLIIIWLTMDNFTMHFEGQWENAVQLMCDVIKC